jgi:KaiC/GvpD/RAD55 family RecA-like ATPase/pimeloyl-ACP methyl ester carboxylesterase
VSIAYATTGQGYPVVKAANWLGHLQFDLQGIWNHWITELSRDNLLVRYDQRGCGLSDRAVQDLSFEGCINDLEAVVDSAGFERFALLGMSHGGSVSIAYAVRHPERVSHLILYGAFARGWSKLGLPPQKIEEMEAITKLIGLGWGRDNPTFRQLFTSGFMPDATAEQMRGFNEYQRVSTSPENAVRFWKLIGDTDVLALLPKVSVPTIVFHARGDQEITFRNGVQLAASIRGARFVPLESRNHILLEDESAWKEFLLGYRRFLGVKGVRVGPPLLTGISSGVPALDELLKGYPRKSAILVVGPSGSAKESVLYRFIQEGLNNGDACLYVTRQSTREVLEDAKGFGIEMEEKGPSWLSTDSEVKCDVHNLAGLSFNIKEILRRNKEYRIRVALDIVSSGLMINEAETIYRFLTQLFQDAKQYDAVLLATVEETMHKPEVLASMEQVFDGVMAIKTPSDSSSGRPTLQVKKMRGTPYTLEMPWETDRISPSPI